VLVDAHTMRARASQQSADEQGAYLSLPGASFSRDGGSRRASRRGTLWRPTAALAGAAACVLLVLAAAHGSLSWARAPPDAPRGARRAAAAATRPPAAGGASGGGASAAANHARAVRVPRPPPLPFPPPEVDDALLRAAVSACAQRQETYIYIDHAAASVVASTSFNASVAGRPCPLVDIMLGFEHRSIGL
jgi:hypothetical protein